MGVVVDVDVVGTVVVVEVLVTAGVDVLVVVLGAVVEQTLVQSPASQHGADDGH